MWLVLCIVRDRVRVQWSWPVLCFALALRVTVVSSVMVVSFVIIVVAGSHCG
jgi:hypothetical protein